MKLNFEVVERPGVHLQTAGVVFRHSKTSLQKGASSEINIEPDIPIYCTIGQISDDFELFQKKG